MMKESPYTLFVDSREFWCNLREEILKAKESVYCQMLTFEGDSAGFSLAEALMESRARDRRLLIDAFSLHMINDRLLGAPQNLFRSDLREEKRRALDLFSRLKRSGAQVKITSPYGFLFRKILLRNHKKVYLVDGKSLYLGGINFSDHNFHWHDLMVRVDDSESARFLEKDFRASWQGNDLGETGEFLQGELKIHLFDGRRNEELFAPLLEKLSRARKSIRVHSPYLSFPFIDSIAEAAKRGAEVSILTPEGNNHPDVLEQILAMAQEGKMKVRLLPGGMSHLKALVVDDEELWLGSSNFDYFCYTLQQEVLARFKDPQILDIFMRRVWNLDWERSQPTAPLDGATLSRGKNKTRLMKLLGKVAVQFSRLQR